MQVSLGHTSWPPGTMLARRLFKRLLYVRVNYGTQF